MNITAENIEAGSLQRYSKLKLDLSVILRNLLHALEQRKDELAVSDCRGLLARLAEDRFNLAMLGQFSRGKSSLINALLGAEKLPTGVLPLTSVITTVAYGESERVLLLREGWSLPQEIRLEELPDYVTQRGNPENEKRVTLAEIQLPDEILRLGMHFIDTPGVASAIRANTRTTRRFLPEVDAAVLITSFDSPLTEPELDFLREIRQYVRKVFIVINKQDLVSPAERDPVLEAIRNSLNTAFPDASFDVFAVSARDALIAKTEGSLELLDESGLPLFEAALTRFVRTDKTRELLLRAADRAEGLIRQQQLAIESPEEVPKIEQRLQEAVVEIARDRESVMQTLRKRLQRDFSERIRPKLDFWNEDLHAQVASEWRHWFLQEPALTADAIHAFICRQAQQLFSRWLSTNRREIENVFWSLIREHGPELDALLVRITDAFVHVLPGYESNAFLSRDSIEPASLNIRDVAVRAGDFKMKWWYELLPTGKVRHFTVAHWERMIPAFVDLYRRSAQATLETSLDDSIREVDQQLATRVERIAAQITTLLEVQAEPAQLDKFLTQVHEFRCSLENIGGESVDEALAPKRSQSPDQMRQCMICTRLERTLWDFLARAQYDLSMDEDQQRRHAAHSGFCPLHTWQYETVSSPQGVCSAYPPVLNRFAERLRALLHEARSVDALAEGLRSRLPGDATCEVCRALKLMETMLTGEIARKSSATDETTALCAYHVYAVLRAKPSPDAAERMLNDLARTLDGIAEEMQNYALKHTAVRHQLTTSTEAQAAFLGLSRLAGSQRIVSPWRVD